jgi:hypothetical protein
MRKGILHVAAHHVDFLALLCCFGAVLVGCLGWLFYTLQAALS